MTALRTLFSLNGRIEGPVYYACVLLSRSMIFGSLFVSSLFAILVGSLIGTPAGPTGAAAVEGAYFLLVGFGVWIALAATVRRLHDLGASGYHTIWVDAPWIVAVFLLGLLQGSLDMETLLFALVALFPSLALGMFPSQPHKNEYGRPRW